MEFGLRIQRKGSNSLLMWMAAAIVVGLITTGVWFAYRWYTHGEQPPMVPLPAAALGDPSINEKPVTEKEVKAYTVPAKQPRYFSINSLAINQRRVVPVGLTENNLLGTPATLDDVAWYQKSGLPGEGGVVVVNGHNGGMSRNGVLANLDRLKIGEKVAIERGDGMELSYRVVSNETMSLERANKEGMKQMFQSPEQGKEALSIMTCAGNWVPRDKVFDKRIIVRAVLDE